MQMIPGASLHVHLSPQIRRNTSSSPHAHFAPAGVTQEAPASPPRAKDSPVDRAREERYQDVLPLPLSGIFSCRAGRPDTIRGKKYPSTIKPKRAGPWDHYSGSEDSAEGREEGDKEGQEFSEVEGGKETPGMGTGKLDHIIESINALALSVSLLQVQADRERRLPPQRTRPAAHLRQVHPQAIKVGLTGTPRRQENPTFPPALIQTLGNPTFPPTPIQYQVRTSDTVAGVASTASDLSIPGLPGIFILLKAGAHKTPQSRLKRLVTLPLGDRPPLVVCLEAP